MVEQNLLAFASYLQISALCFLLWAFQRLGLGYSIYTRISQQQQVSGILLHQSQLR